MDDDLDELLDDDDLDDDVDDDDLVDGTDDDEGLFDQCEFLERLCRIMDRHGWATRCVEGGPRGPRHAYTVGLFQHDEPELIVFGMPFAAADRLLGTLAGRIRGGARFTHGQVLDIVGPPGRVMLLDVADTTQYLPDAVGFIEPPPPGVQALRAWQVVYPDPMDRWPWQPGSQVADLPVLGLVPEGV
jgi:Domain of unknown function (DUF4262)